MLSNRVSNFGISGLLFCLGISKTLAGPMDLQFFKVLDEARDLRFLSLGNQLTYREGPKPYEALIPTKALKTLNPKKSKP